MIELEHRHGDEPAHAHPGGMDEEHRHYTFENWQRIESARDRMRTWAEAHGEADTQGLMPDEWTALAIAALGTDEPAPRY